MSESQKTPLNQWHRDHGGKMVSFAGWDMPVQYEEGLKSEHLFTRQEASVFDVSHMGEFRFKGVDALKALDYLSPSKVSELAEGESCYSFFPNEKGGVVDDLLIYCFQKNTDYLICVNASNTEKIEKHILNHITDSDVQVVNESAMWGQVAIQGPKAVALTEGFIEGVSNLKRFGFGAFQTKTGFEVCVARTGYTGEDGFEIFVEAGKTKDLWCALLDLGARPCGLGARDTLRLEAALNLYGNELNETCNPFECRLGWTIDLEKESFLGKNALLDLKASSAKRLVGVKALERAIPRQGYEIYDGESLVGEVTSGTMSPSLSEPIAMAWIDKKALEGEKKLEVQIRKKRVPLATTKLPFLKNN